MHMPDTPCCAAVTAMPAGHTLLNSRRQLLMTAGVCSRNCSSANFVSHHLYGCTSLLLLPQQPQCLCLQMPLWLPL
jgi:hypothetical protein